MSLKGMRGSCSVALLIVPLVACSPGHQPGTSLSSGQVKAPVKASMTIFAASRSAEQVSFGATPALISELRQIGLEDWIEAQFRTPLGRIDLPFDVMNVNGMDALAQQKEGDYFFRLLLEKWLTGQDQLRQRVTWALLEFIPVTTQHPPANAQYFNVLQANAFGNYADLLKAVTLSPPMGAQLGNYQNRPRSTNCIGCTPNENFARELMQLFSLGVVRLNADGTTSRDAYGKARETYTQKDVEELARALTGWRFANVGVTLAMDDQLNSSVPMVPETWDGAHDTGAKTVMGVSFPAHQTIQQDLDSAIAMLMDHPNIAPFVSLRLIQHLTASDPSPQYISRVATVFRNNGRGVTGDMKAVIRAVLLDPEARLGDSPGIDGPGFGKIREPMLWLTSTLRGLNCKAPLVGSNNDLVWMYGQIPFNADSIFSFYLPTDRAPGSNLLAPEQRLLNTSEFLLRLNTVQSALLDVKGDPNAHAGCELSLLADALSKSPEALVDQIETRWFRGAMPPSLRTDLVTLAVFDRSQLALDPNRVVTRVLGYALTSAFFGVIQ